MSKSSHSHTLGSGYPDRPLVELSHLNKSYGQKSILKDLSLEIPRGKIIGLLGPNGAGKTTLIKLIVGLLTLTSGELSVNGEPVGPNSKLAISYLPEQTYLDKSMTIEQILNFFTDFYANFDREKAYQLLAKLNLDPRARLGHMSKGMQEKVQLSLVMARRAELYILDEPLGGVDPATRDYVLDTILANFSSDGGSSLLISTHLIADIERILDEVIFIGNGRILQTGSADALRAEHHASIDQIFRKEFKNV